MTAVAALGAMGALTFLLASVLLLASRALRVEEDPRVDRVEELLPHNNCGACGYAGCRAFAEALVAGEAVPAACTVASAGERAAVAALLGVDVGVSVRRVARLACAGGTNVARERARYVGPSSCVEAAQVGGGGKACAWGCLGFGDCEAACDFDAIAMDRHRLPVVDADKCTACGDCVEICPKDLFSLLPVDERLWVKCRSREVGDEVLQECEVACTACGRCAVDAPPGVVAMKDGLPVVDAGELRRHPADTVRPAIDRCPTGAIVWIGDDNVEIRGRQSKRVVRHAPLPPAL